MNRRNLSPMEKWRNTMLEEIIKISSDVKEVRNITMSDPRNQWIAHARVILNDTLVHLPDGELKKQVYNLLGDDCI